MCVAVFNQIALMDVEILISCNLPVSQEYYSLSHFYKCKNNLELTGLVGPVVRTWLKALEVSCH